MKGVTQQVLSLLERTYDRLGRPPAYDVCAVCESIQGVFSEIESLGIDAALTRALAGTTSSPLPLPCRECPLVSRLSLAGFGPRTVA